MTEELAALGKCIGYHPLGTVIGAICKYSSHVNSALQVESNWLKDHPALYSTDFYITSSIYNL